MKVFQILFLVVLIIPFAEIYLLLNHLRSLLTKTIGNHNT